MQVLLHTNNFVNMYNINHGIYPMNKILKSDNIKQHPLKKIAIIGAGPGGLAASLLLAYQGHKVTIFEANDRVGGRSSLLEFDGFKFDAGPTFFIYRYVLDEIFSKIGEKLDEHVELRKIEPLYDLYFGQKVFRPYQNHALMMKEIHQVFPGEEKGYQSYLKHESKRFKKLLPVLRLPFHSPLQFFNPKVLYALDEIDISRSLYQRLKKYFHSEEMIYSMAFQAKYLGMSPWECPSLFSILSYMEHEYGVYHVMGGLYHLNEKMALLAKKLGVTIKLNSPVSQLIVEKKTIKKIRVDQKFYSFDSVIMNGDFSKTISLLENRHRPTKYQDQGLNKLDYSCSTFNLYLGLDKVFSIAHHNIIFSKNYRQYVQELTKKMILSEDPSFYVHNPSIIDPSYAPKGKSSVYVLVPVPNLKAKIDWEKIKKTYTEKIIDRLSKMPGLKDLRKHIISQTALTPLDWQNQYHVYLGANFNLSHKFSQLLYLRPHNQFSGLKNLYLVGGGTHPGSGLPTIYQSALIASDLINR
jgi:phytoene desaturase